MIIALPLVAALLLAVGFVLQQRAAAAAPPTDMLRFRLLWDLMHSPSWLIGIAAMVCGQIVSAIALGRESVSIVEPLLASNLLIALLLSSALAKSRLCRSDWIGSIVLGCGLAAFIVAGQPAAATGKAAGIRQWVAAASIAAVAAVLVVLARRQPLLQEGTLLAGAAGCLAGLQDGLTRTSVLRLDHGVSALLTIWEPYAVLGVAVLVILLQQSAFEAAALRDTLPAVTVGEPVAGIAFGIVALGDRVRTAPWALAVEVAGLLAMVVGVYVLATSDLLTQAAGESPDTNPPESR